MRNERPVGRMGVRACTSNKKAARSCCFNELISLYLKPIHALVCEPLLVGYLNGAQYFNILLDFA